MGDTFQYAKLPSAAGLPEEMRNRVTTLLESLAQVTVEKAKILSREDDIQEELTNLQKSTGQPGFRHELLCFACVPVSGKKSLDKMLLIEAGVSAATIAGCYKQGKPHSRNMFKRLPEEK